MTPLLTLANHEVLDRARRSGSTQVEVSLDLERSRSVVECGADQWRWRALCFPYLSTCKDRTVYHWDGARFEPVARFGSSLIKLVPTQWGAPTFEIDGIKMLPTAKVSPYEDARQKVDLVQPQGKAILDTCGGLGYFAAWCLQRGAASITSFEKNADVIWLRSLNPWSPDALRDARLQLTHGDVLDHIAALPDAAFGAVLHDPPRFGIAGDLYAETFYRQLARVLRRGGRLFHYTGTPNRLTSGRDVPQEVAKRLQRAGFSTRLSGDGVLAVKRG